MHRSFWVVELPDGDFAVPDLTDALLFGDGAPPALVLPLLGHFAATPAKPASP